MKLGAMFLWLLTARAVALNLGNTTMKKIVEEAMGLRPLEEKLAKLRKGLGSAPLGF